MSGRSEKAPLIDTNQPLRKSYYKTMVTMMTNAIAFVAALAWNEVLIIIMHQKGIACECSSSNVFIELYVDIEIRHEHRAVPA